jgi:hypothetical protein
MMALTVRVFDRSASTARKNRGREDNKDSSIDFMKGQPVFSPV